jgi:hypothetical protein
VSVGGSAYTLWGALTRFRSDGVVVIRRVVRPSRRPPSSWSCSGRSLRLFRHVLQLAAFRLRSDEFKELEIVVLRHVGRPELSPAGRSSLSRCREPSAAANELALVCRHTDDTASLAPPPGREALDVPKENRPAAHWRRDPRACAAPRTGEPAVGGISGSSANFAGSASRSRPRLCASCFARLVWAPPGSAWDSPGANSCGRRRTACSRSTCGVR